MEENEDGVGGNRDDDYSERLTLGKKILLGDDSLSLTKMYDKIYFLLDLYSLLVHRIANL